MEDEQPTPPGAAEAEGEGEAKESKVEQAVLPAAEPDPLPDLPSEAAEHIPLGATLGSVHDDNGDDEDATPRDQPAVAPDTGKTAASTAATGAANESNGAAGTAAASSGGRRSRASTLGDDDISVISSVDPSPDKLAQEIVADEQAASSSAAAATTPPAPTAAAGRHDHIDHAPPATGHEFDMNNDATPRSSEENSTRNAAAAPSSSAGEAAGKSDATAAAAASQQAAAKEALPPSDAVSTPPPDDHDDEDNDGNASSSSDDVSSINSMGAAARPRIPSIPAAPPSTPIGYPGQANIYGPDASMGYVGKGRLKSPPLSGRRVVGEDYIENNNRRMPAPPFGMDATPKPGDDDGDKTPNGSPLIQSGPTPQGNGSGEAHVDVPTPSDTAIDAEVSAMPTEKRRGGAAAAAAASGNAAAKRPPPDSSATTAASASSAAATKGRPKKRARKTHTEDFTSWAVGRRYQLMRILGRGSYGEVAQAKDLTYRPAPSPTNIPGHPAHVQQGAKTPTEPDDTHDYPDNHGHGPYVAVKRIAGAFEQEIDAVRLYREMHILRRLRGHECIVNLLDVIEPARVERVKPSPSKDDSPMSKEKRLQYPDLTNFTDLYMVFEYVDTDLYKLIMSPQYLTTEHIQTFLYQMLAGVKFIHSASVIHRDIKPANILLNEDCSLKICDFGLARIVNRDTMSPRGVSERDGDESSNAAASGAGAGDDSSTGGSDLNGAPTRSPPKPGFTRQLTKHVVTRWYRAPELILIQPYTSAVDIWSLGCILAELLSMQEESVPSYQDRVPLFPGGSCYPLSGEGASVKSDERLDQLSVIFSVIGTPSDEDINSIGKAKDYIATLKKRPGRPIESQYPAADPAAIDLLKKMLQFNPKKRCTVEEALHHPFLKNVRRAEMERGAQRPLVGPEFLETNHVDMDELKRKSYEEVMYYRKIEEQRARKK